MDPDEIRPEITDGRLPSFFGPFFPAPFFAIGTLEKLPHPAPTPRGFAGDKIISHFSRPISCGHPYLNPQLP